ncbi:MAG TPA: TonB-dependent receptor [Novosphingobium sp.]|nr:TonB-dependent receptor [Novosphingobium sp.]
MGQEIPQLSLRAAFLCTIAVPVAVAASPVRAQEANDSVQASEAASAFDIVVTAQKREQLLQDVPVAVSVVTQESLQANRIVNIRDLDGLTPGLSVRKQSGGNALSSFSMRGILTSGDAPARDRGIGMYIDGVYIGNAFGSMMSMPDIAQIEVLRGPQGTLFGRNSTGGAISITTREPDGKFRFKQGVTLGNYHHIRSVTSVSSPQIGPFSVLGSFVYSKERGDTRNIGGGTRWDFSQLFGRPVFKTAVNYLGGNESKSAFAAAKADLGEFKLVYRFDFTRETSSAPAQGIAYLSPAYRDLIANQPNQAILPKVTKGRPKEVNNWANVPSDLKVYGHSLTATWDVSDAIQIKNVAAHRKTRVWAPSSDASGMGGLINTGSAYLIARINPASADAAVGSPLLINTSAQDNRFKQWSNELQLDLDTDPFHLTAGALYFQQNAFFGGYGEENSVGLLRNGSFVVFPNFQQPGTVPPPALTGGRRTFVKTKSYAAYGQIEFHLRDDIDLVGGIRYTKDRKTGVDRSVRSSSNANEFPIDYTGSKVTYLVGINYKPTDDMLFYGKLSTAYISGGVSSTIPFDPETAKSFEAGIKADWLDGRLRTNLALYTAKYGNITTTPLTSSIPAYAFLIPLGVGTVTTNTGAARAKGFELETMFAPSDRLLLSANLAYLDFHYTSLAPVVTQGTLDYQVVNRPKWTSALSAQYTSADLSSDGMHLIARVDATWRSLQHGTAVVPLPGNANAGGAAFTLAEVETYRKAADIPAYWIVNGRIALNDISLAGVKGTVALWGRNLFNDKSGPFPIGFTTHVTAMYERARTFGVDFQIEF